MHPTIRHAREDDLPIPGAPHGEHSFSNVPVEVYGNQTFATIGVGSSFSCALDVDGQSWCWGVGKDSGWDGMLGTNQTTYSSTPVPVAGNHTFLALAVGEIRACALKADGQAFCWGCVLHARIVCAHCVALF